MADSNCDFFMWADSCIGGPEISQEESKKEEQNLPKNVLGPDALPKNVELHLTDRDEDDLFQRWKIHEDPSCKFFRLENLGLK